MVSPYLSHTVCRAVRRGRAAALPLLIVGLLMSLSSSAHPFHYDNGERIPLWGDSTGSHVGQASITPYLTDASATAVIIFPGGSYFWIGSGGEGDAVGRWLQAQGVNAFVVRYRVAGWWSWFTHGRLLRRGICHPDMYDDGQQALRWVRQRAAHYGIDTARIGVMGFSAGGHLASVQACYGALRPAFVAAIYPVVTMTDPSVHQRSRRGLVGEHWRRKPTLCDSLSVERHIPANCPPFFIVVCDDDPVVDYRNALLLDSALTRRAIPHHLFRCATGGHGFGVSDKKGSAESRPWKTHFIGWLKTMHLL